MKKYLKSLLLITAVVALVASLAVFASAASSGTCGSNVRWTLDDSGTLTISGTGAMKDFYWCDSPWYSQCNNIKTVVIKDGVTSIGRYAFQYCTSLTSVVIPDSVKTIGASAFEECESLTSVTIPDSVTSIEGSAFVECRSLTSIVIPDSVTSIEGSAFAWCTSLASVTIPDSVTSIGYGAFYYCTSLTSVTIPDSVTSIGISAFASCKKLGAINVDSENENYASINGILYNKHKTHLIQYPAGKSDKSFTIPDSVTTIEEYAFYGTENLEGIDISAKIYAIEEYALAYNTMGYINVDEGNSRYASINGVLYDKEKKSLYNTRQENQEEAIQSHVE